jgi:hypothetical protein
VRGDDSIKWESSTNRLSAINELNEFNIEHLEHENTLIKKIAISWPTLDREIGNSIFLGRVILQARAKQER